MGRKSTSLITVKKLSLGTFSGYLRYVRPPHPKVNHQDEEEFHLPLAHKLEIYSSQKHSQRLKRTGYTRTQFILKPSNPNYVMLMVFCRI